MTDSRSADHPYRSKLWRMDPVRLKSLDSDRLPQAQKVGLVQAANSRGGGSIAPRGRQSPPDDIRSGSVYGFAIGQALRGSLRFCVNDARRQIVESNCGSLAE